MDAAVVVRRSLVGNARGEEVGGGQKEVATGDRRARRGRAGAQSRCVAMFSGVAAFSRRATGSGFGGRGNESDRADDRASDRSSEGKTETGRCESEERARGGKWRPSPQSAPTSRTG